MGDDLSTGDIAILRRRRAKFVWTLALAFVIATVAAWWIVPAYAAKLNEIRLSASFELPFLARSFLQFASVFRYLWITFAASSVVLGALAHFGLLDSFLPFLNGLLFILAALLVVVCLAALFMPAMAMAAAAS